MNIRNHVFSFIRTALVIGALIAGGFVAPDDAHGQVGGPYSKFGPVNGIMKGSVSTYNTSAALSTDVTTLFCGTSTTLFLRADGTCAVPAGTGVTSVTETVPAGFAITGSPGTGAVSLGISYATGQSANLFLATPNGTTGALSERAIVGADLPPINLGSTANGGVASASILLGTNGGTSNGFFSITGPATSLKTFTFPNASATVLTSNAAVTVAQGGTGLATLTANGVLLGEGTSNVNPLVMGADTVLRGTASADPVAAAVPNCGSSSQALSYNTSTHSFGCQSITGTATPGGATSNVQFNSSGSMAGDSGFTYTGSASDIVKLTGGSGVPSNIVYAQSAAGADQKQVSTYYNYNGGSPSFNMTFLNDASNAESKFLSVTRGTGTAVTGVTLGNPTDLPAITINGTPTFTTGFMTLTGTTNGFSMIDTNATTTNRAWSTGNFSSIWHLRPCNDNVTTCGADAIAIARSGNVVTSASFGAPSGTAQTFIEGHRTIWGRWTISAGCATVAGSGTFGFSGAASSGAGNCTLNFSPSFNATPICTATAENIGNPAISLSSPSTGAVVVTMLNAGASTNGNFAITCTGT